MRSALGLVAILLVTSACEGGFEVVEGEPGLDGGRDGGTLSGGGGARGTPEAGSGGTDATDGAMRSLAFGADGRVDASGGAGGANVPSDDGGMADPGGDGSPADPAGDGGAAGAGDGGCLPTGLEICDGVDNDCNGIIDDGPLCACEVHSFGGKSYLFCSKVASWPLAEAFCVARGGHLASIESKAEDDWLTRTAVGIISATWWMGFNDRVLEKQWVWTDGSPTTYLHWAKDQPNNKDGNEDCGELNRAGITGGWNDQPCDDFQPFICKAVPGELRWP
jgi:hypothetical protein